MQRADQIRIAAHAWDYAITLCIRTLPQGPEREALIACGERPNIANVRAALAIGRGPPLAGADRIRTGRDRTRRH